ncbi:MAG: isocitrate/isopropylmalate dehydrogenase family protein [Planctomycetes bacterium]|nr:isocitrate/isopropylmalate dehydrogenase family protein [Planctomycetota bacterium]
MQQYSLAVLAGDGIGPKVTAEARQTIDAAADRYGFVTTWHEFPFGAEYYLRHGVALPASALAEMADFHAMLLGAIGDPRVPPGPLEQEILLALRFHFDQYVNLRPALSFPGVPLPVPLPADTGIDAVVVRENTEDFYMGIGGAGSGRLADPISAVRGLYRCDGAIELGFPEGMEAAYSLGLMTRPAIERITRYACSLARQRGEATVHVVSKANAVPHLYGFWDRVVRETAAEEFPDLTLNPVNVDALCYLMARQPAGWGVVLCPNLFGDIVSDLLSALAGGLGLAAAGNIGDGLSMFEPVHGSAPTIAGTGRANPLAAILSGALLLDHLGQREAARAVENAVRHYLTSGQPQPVEQGGTATVTEVGAMVRDHLQ